jgi:hypothetical protein
MRAAADAQKAGKNVALSLDRGRMHQSFDIFVVTFHVLFCVVALYTKINLCFAQ